MSNETQDRETLAALLLPHTTEGHIADPDEHSTGCWCKARWGRTSNYAEHLAQTLLTSDWLVAHDAAVKAEAVHEVALRWQYGEWSGLPVNVGPPAVPAFARAQYVTDWLRAQARFYQPEGGDPS